MNSCIKYEDVKNLGNLDGIDDFKGFEDRNGFVRDFRFGVRGNVYTISWWKNVCYLNCGEMTVVFDDIRYDGCYPNSFEKSLVFKRFGNTIAIIPVLQYGDLD